MTYPLAPMTDDELVKLAAGKLKVAQNNYRTSLAICEIAKEAEQFIPKDKLKAFQKSVTFPFKRKNAKAAQAVLFWSDLGSVRDWKFRVTSVEPQPGEDRQ